MSPPIASPWPTFSSTTSPAVASSAHLRSPIVFDDLHYASRDYEPWAAYGQSKTANILFAVEATRRWAGDGIFVNSPHPGSIRTALRRHVSAEDLERARRAAGGGGVRWKSTRQGAATSVLLATAPLLDGVGGRYFEDRNEADWNQPGTRHGVAPVRARPGRGRPALGGHGSEYQ
jgi:NAD(P)-dependent dehydrogenase (short-subunit alcohol dehydrogenase family)